MSDTSMVKDLFAGALELPPVQREEFLRRECAGNAELLTELRELIGAHERGPRFLEMPVVAAEIKPLPPPGEDAGSLIGRYRLLQKIGEGGFGVVFLAEQREPVVRRVALKIIKAGMDTAQVIARFEAERQALAVMDHPNIAKVLDAGATDSGRPYFVMELVKGEPITTFSDKNTLTIRERLELFVQVCLAVQHAHTKGVIHRDIKPSNVLVSTHDGNPRVRVIDFGIAKATVHSLTAKTIFTEFRQLIGTPEYMSPEQADGGLDIDTRTDVYSLGVLLYELLTGSTPFDPERLRSAAYAELQRIIREVEPPKPSTRLSKSAEALPGVAAQRRIDPARLGVVLRRDLDWIVMKALEKDRSRRYETPSGLGSDVQRYLAGEPVTAAPPGLSYRLRKFVHRHRVGAIAGSLIAAALVLGVVGTTIGLLNARAARDRAIGAETLANQRYAEAESARVRASEAEKLAQERLAEAEKARIQAERYNKIASGVTDFFTNDVLDLRPTPPGRPELTVREALERVPQKIDSYFKSEPAVEGAIRERVGQLYLNMGDPERAAEYLGPAASLLEASLGRDDRATLRAKQRLAELLLELDRFEQAEQAFDQVYQSRLRVLGPEDQFTLNSLSRRGLSRIWGGRAEEGLKDVEEATFATRRIFGAEHRSTIIFNRGLVEAYSLAGRGEDAEKLARSQLEFIDAHRAEFGSAEPEFRAVLGRALIAQERCAEALVEIDQALEVLSKSFPAWYPKIVDLRINRGDVLEELGKLDEADTELQGVYRALEERYGVSATGCRKLAGELADLAEKRGDRAAAIAWREKR